MTGRGAGNCAGGRSAGYGRGMGRGMRRGGGFQRWFVAGESQPADERSQLSSLIDYVAQRLDDLKKRRDELND